MQKRLYRIQRKYKKIKVSINVLCAVLGVYHTILNDNDASLNKIYNLLVPIPHKEKESIATFQDLYTQTTFINFYKIKE